MGYCYSFVVVVIVFVLVVVFCTVFVAAATAAAYAAAFAVFEGFPWKGYYAFPWALACAGGGVGEDGRQRSRGSVDGGGEGECWGRS